MKGDKLEKMVDFLQPKFELAVIRFIVADPDSNTTVTDLLRILRALRPLRAVQQWENTRVSAISLFKRQTERSNNWSKATIRVFSKN